MYLGFRNVSVIIFGYILASLIYFSAIVIVQKKGIRTNIKKNELLKNVKHVNQVDAIESLDINKHKIKEREYKI